MQRESNLKQTHRFCEVLLSAIGGPRSFGGKPLGEPRKGTDRERAIARRNLKKVIGAQYLWICLLRDMCPCGRMRRWENLLIKLGTLLPSVDVSDWLKGLDELDALLLSSCEDIRRLSELQRWETAAGDLGVRTMFMHRLHTLLKGYWGMWRRDQSVFAFRRLHQIFQFPKKLSLELKQLHDVALDQWWRIERSEFAPRPDIVTCRAVASIISEWFPKSREKEFYEHFSPRHGPGSVAEGCRTKDEKFLSLCLSDRQWRMMSDHDLWSKIGKGCMQFPLYHQDQPCDTRKAQRIMFPDRPAMGDQVCKQVFVNKSWKTYRTISMEPATTQWLQQGLGACFDYYVKHHPGLSYYYRIDSEETNRTFCYDGSIDGFYATLDASAASDCVSWPVVRVLFEDTFLMEGLSATRTPFVLVEDCDIIEMLKFAPMGSRLCFPVESIVFAACIELAARRHAEKHGKSIWKGWPVGAVFGDDAIVQNILVESVLEIYNGLGLVINKEKSFYNTSGAFFRESCGAEFLNGLDVHPLRLSREFPGLVEATDTRLTNLVELANAAYDREYRTVRAAIVDHVLSVCPNYLFDSDGKHGIKSVNPHNRHLRTKWSDDLQCTLYECTCFHRQKIDRICWSKRVPLECSSSASAEDYLNYLWGRSAANWSDPYRLFEWFRLHPKRHLDEHGRPEKLLWPDQIIDLDLSQFSSVSTHGTKWVTRADFGPEIPL